MIDFKENWLKAHQYRNHEYKRPLIGTHFIDFLIKKKCHEFSSSKMYITFLEGGKEKESMTYSILFEMIFHFSYWLKKIKKIPSNEKVALIPNHDVKSVIAIFSFIRSGNSILFLNSNSTEKRIKKQLVALKIKKVFSSDTNRIKTIKTIKLPSIEKLKNVGVYNKFKDINLYRDAFFFPTSGTTADSKIVSQSLYNALINAKAIKDHIEIKEDTKMLGCLPIHHVNGFHFSLFAMFVARAHLVQLKKFEPLIYLRYIRDYKPDLASVVPSILESLLKVGNFENFPKNFRFFVTAASALKSEIARIYWKKFGIRIVQGYGLSETTNFSSMMPVSVSNHLYKRIFLDQKILPIGVPLFGNEMNIFLPDGKEASLNQIGEICIRGHNVMNGYLKNKKENTKVFLDGWFHTQDQGFRQIYGGKELFTITGRTKNIVKIKGETVSLEEMERILMEHKAISDVACVSILSDLCNEKIILFYVSDLEIEIESIISKLREYFSKDTLPRNYYRIEKIPRNQTGKLIRSSLIKYYEKWIQDEK